MFQTDITWNIIQATFLAIMTKGQTTVPKIDFQLMRVEIFEVIAKILVQKERGDAFQNHRVRACVRSSVGDEHSLLEKS